jgi:hypothetical protein
MFNSSANDKAIATSNFECGVSAGYLQMPAHDINNLVVRMAAAAARPPFGHFVLGEKKSVVLSHHSASQTWFGRSRLRRVIRHDGKIRKGFRLLLHLTSGMDTSRALEMQDELRRDQLLICAS